MSSVVNVELLFNASAIADVPPLPILLNEMLSVVSVLLGSKVFVLSKKYLTTFCLYNASAKAVTPISVILVFERSSVVSVLFSIKILPKFFICSSPKLLFDKSKIGIFVFVIASANQSGSLNNCFISVILACSSEGV